MTSFNFEDSEIKMNYAKAKIVISSAIGLVYAMGAGLVYLISNSNSGAS